MKISGRDFLKQTGCTACLFPGFFAPALSPNHGGFIDYVSPWNSDSSLKELWPAILLIHSRTHVFLNWSLAVEEQRLPPDLEKYAIVGLCMKYVRKAELDKVPGYIDLLNERYPDFNYYGSKSILNCVENVKHSIDSLRKLNLDEDEYLFKEAGLKEKLVYCGWTDHSMV